MQPKPIFVLLNTEGFNIGQYKYCVAFQLLITTLSVDYSLILCFIWWVVFQEAPTFRVGVTINTEIVLDEV